MRGSNQERKTLRDYNGILPLRVSDKKIGISHRGGGLKKIPSVGEGGMDIFWNPTK